MAIRPLGERVVLKPVEVEEKTKSGLILAGDKEKPEVAEVVAIGDEVKALKVGENVFYKKYSGTEVKYENQEYILIAEEDVLAVVE